MTYPGLCRRLEMTRSTRTGWLQWGRSIGPKKARAAFRHAEISAKPLGGTLTEAASDG